MILAWQPLGETESESGLERCNPEVERPIQIALARARFKLVQNPSGIRGWPVVGKGLPGQTAGRTPPRRTRQREFRSWPVRPTRPTRERESGSARGETRGGGTLFPLARPAARAGRAGRGLLAGTASTRSGGAPASAGSREGRPRAAPGLGPWADGKGFPWGRWGRSVRAGAQEQA